MGARAEYWEIPSGNIREAIIEDFVQLTNWYISLEKEFPEETDCELLQSLKKISKPKKLFKELDQSKIDDLITIYVGDFCNSSTRKLNQIDNSSFLNIRYYYDDQKAINEKCSDDTKHIWNFILTGRSMIESKSFNFFNDVFRFCILSESECQELHKELSKKFDTRTTDGFNKHPGIGSLIKAIENKQGEGILITVA